MIIQNTSGKIIYLGFVRQGIELQPNETTEVDEAFTIDDPTFRVMENAGDLTIISFEGDLTRSSVRQEVQPFFDDFENRITTLEGGGPGVSGLGSAFDFIYWSVPSNLGPVGMWITAVADTQYPIHSAGFLVRLAAKVTAPRTAGTINLVPTINGTPVTPTDLNSTIGPATPSVVTNDAPDATAGLAVAKNDLLGLNMTVSGYAPIDEQIQATLYVKFT